MGLHMPANVSAPAGRAPLTIFGPAPADRLPAAGKSMRAARHACGSGSDEAAGSRRCATSSSSVFICSCRMV
jgi:hypothetical protein